MTKQVVDLLEAVEIKAQHGKLARRGHRQFDLLVEPLIEAAAVWQPGQQVVMGEKADVLLRILARLKIAHRDGAMGFAGEIDRAHDELDWISRSVPLEEIAFEGEIGGFKKPKARAFIREKLMNLRADQFARQSSRRAPRSCRSL